MKILIYPALDYVCAKCEYHMLVQKSDIHPLLALKERTVECVNERCEFYGKKATIKPVEVEMEEV